MPIVVTGAAGFIGRATVTALLATGHGVVGIDRRPAPAADGYTHLRSDLTERGESTLTALREADAVVHLAGRPGVRDHDADIARARWTDNVLAGEVVLAHTPPDTPIVAASSSSVYGGARRGPTSWLACHEDQPLDPRGGYARSKVVFEQRCQARRVAGGHVTVVRPFTVAGPGQRPDMAIATWIEQSRRGEPMTVLGSLSRRRDITEVDDVVRGIIGLLAITRPTTVNLGTGTTVSLQQLTQAVADAVGRPHRVAVRTADAAEVPVTRAHTRRCRDLLGFVPVTHPGPLVRRQAHTLITPPTTSILEPV